MTVVCIILVLIILALIIFQPSDLISDQAVVILIIAMLMILSILLAASYKIFFVDKVKRLVTGQIKITPEDFLKLRKRRDIPSFKGVYVLHNKSKHKYYVGQAVNVAGRVTSHFTGKGNGDVYADWKYGNKFTIMMIPLKGSGKKDLNELERCAIKKYHAYSKGYNKTQGNS